ncbi:glycosyltransferase family 4 protein [Flavobacterium sp. CYK-4]|nr:glycosyltransferase family 4 protein [Flavobacterium lotistagni]
MNIAFLTPEYPHKKVAHAAGIGTSIQLMAEELARQGHRVSVFIYGQQYDEVLLENGVKIHLIKQKPFRFFSWYRYRKHLQSYLNQYITADQIKIIEAPDWTGITAFMKLKAPIVLRLHGTDAYFCQLEGRKQKVKNFILEKLAIQGAAAYAAPTTYAGAITREIFGIKNKPIRTLHNGLLLGQFHNPTPEQYTPGLILYIGTIIRKKGVFELPGILEKVVAQYPQAKLVMIGRDTADIKTNSNSTWNLLEKGLSRAVKDKIEYLGQVPYQEIQQHIKNANVCVFPTFAETLGMVTIESMAMQKAVVNSDMGWSKELIEDRVNGFLVHPQNHDLYAERILELLRQPDLCHTIGKAARLKVEQQFDIEQKVKENVSFYQEIIEKK